MELFWLYLNFFLFTISHLRLRATSSLGFSFLTCKMGIIVLITLYNYFWELSEQKENMYPLKISHHFSNNYYIL